MILIKLSLNCIHSIKLGLLPNFEKRNRNWRLYAPHAFPLDQTTFFTPSTIHNRVLTKIKTNIIKPPPFLDKFFWKSKFYVLKKMSSSIFARGKMRGKNVHIEIIYNVVR